MYNKLKGFLVENSITQKEFSEILGISITTVNFKLNGKSDFTIQEGKKICELLNEPFDVIFFTKNISKMKTE